MKRTGLGSRGTSLPALGLGGTGLANMYTGVSDDEAGATIDRAFGLGIDYIDTAPAYGAGLSESRIGAALRGRARDSFVLSSKAGYVFEELPEDAEVESLWSHAPRVSQSFDFSRGAILSSIEQSLERLGVDRLDMVAIHDPDGAASVDPDAGPYDRSHFAQAMDEAYPALAELRDQGVIDCIGVGLNGWEMLADFARARDFDYFLLAGRYTLLEQEPAAELFPLCLVKGIKIVVGGAFSSGILAADDPSTARYNYAEPPAEVVDRVRRLAGICSDHGVSLKAAALQFPLAHPVVASIVVGARSAAEIEENAALLDVEVPAALWSDMVDAELLDASVPLPGADRSA